MILIDDTPIHRYILTHAETSEFSSDGGDKVMLSLMGALTV